MDSIGASLEAEQKAKAEALRIKKKLESDINELEIGEFHSNIYINNKPREWSIPSLI